MNKMCVQNSTLLQNDEWTYLFNKMSVKTRWINAALLSNHRKKTMSELMLFED